jgi:hypothetical protein
MTIANLSSMRLPIPRLNRPGPWFRVGVPRPNDLPRLRMGIVHECKFTPAGRNIAGIIAQCYTREQKICFSRSRSEHL